MAMAIEMGHTSALIAQEPNQESIRSGMVRIERSGKHQWIWPVHLPGWLALGWQLNQPIAASSNAQATELAAFIAPQPEAETPQAGSAAAKRRGRKAKVVDAGAITEAAQAPLTIENEPQSEPVVDSQEPTAGADLVGDGQVQAVSSGTDSGFALPEDLLSAEF